MTGKGGATSAPPAIKHQEGKTLRVGFMLRIMKGSRSSHPSDGTDAGRRKGSKETLRAGFMVATMKGSRSRWPVRSLLGRPLVGQGKASHNVPGQRVHGGNHEPFHDGAGSGHHGGKLVCRIRGPVPCMRTHQPNQRPPNHNQAARQLDRGVASSPSSAGWETHLSCSRGPRNRAIMTAVLRHQFLCCEDNPPPFDRSAKTKREPVGLTVSPPSATIMKVAARHEGQSKIDEQLHCSWWRCRWPRSGPVPELYSGSLRWAICKHRSDRIRNCVRR